MEVTLSKILWIVGALVLAALVVFGLLNWGIAAMQRGDAAILEVAAYDDGVVYFTVKNTGTIPITAITIDGASASGTLPLEGGGESQFTATGLTLTAGEMHTFTIVVTFSNGQTKTIRAKTIVQRA